MENDQNNNNHNRTNHFQSVIMVIAMAGIMGICGFAIGGTMGLFLALGFAAFTILGAGRATASLVLKMYKANPLTREQAPGLIEIFDTLVERANLEHRPKLYYVPSEMMNAFATGRNENVAVAVTDGLLRNMTPREIAGVLAHELSHVRHRDIFVMSIADAFSRVTATIGQIGIYMLMFAIPSVMMGMKLTMLGGLVLLLAPSASAMLQLALSRSREYEADRGAAEITGDPLGLAMALKKIEVAHTGVIQKILLPGRKSPEPALLRTHPPTEERIARLKAMAGMDQSIKLPEPEILAKSFQPQTKIRRPRWHLTGLWY